jgi:hypothetical protein
MPNWEDQFEEWESKYKPIENKLAGCDKFETYGKELDYVLSIANTEPARVWTLVDGDDGNLYIVSGYHLVNRINYFITQNPCELEYEEYPYFIYEEDEEEV